MLVDFLHQGGRPLIPFRILDVGRVLGNGVHS